jgi:acetyl-CoA acyltransferase
MPDNNEVVIVSAVRSAVGKGKKEGALATTHPVELSALVMNEAIRRSGVDMATIDDIAWGCAMPEASQGLNVARLSALRAGIPVEVPAQTINRFCSSGLQTVANGAMQIMSGMADVVLTGGIEMMSQVPMSGYHARLDDDAMESYIGMGFTAERVADRWKVSRADQDAWALRSQQKAAAALARGAFTDQIVPVPVERVSWKGTEKQVDTLTFAQDELVRAETTAEGLAKLRPAFKANAR